MTDCQHCGKPASGTLCAKCTADYWAMIYQLGHVQLPAPPLPIDTHAQDLIADSEAWLAEQAGKIRPQYADYRWRKAWYAIISNRHTVLNMSTAADDYASLQHIIRRNERALTPEDELIILGNCQNCDSMITGTPESESVK